jgi:ribosome maturation factor RimP
LFVPSHASNRANLLQVIESTAEMLGFELVDAALVQGGRLVRVFIEHAGEVGPVPSRPITLDDCERMTRQLQRVLEVEGIDYGRLEVSSPGLDRVLKKPADFRRFAGERAEVRLRMPLNGRRRFVGTVRSASDDVVDLEVDGGVVSLELANVEKARLVPAL